MTSNNRIYLTMQTEFSRHTRSQNIEILKAEPLDVLVIGGGIVGAGLIRDLALNGGIKAGLIEQGDFASGTSGASSQLIHGGFRYIAKRDIALVKQSRKERETLTHIAPNLVKPIPLAILRYKGDPYPLAGIRIAAQYYNHLSKSDSSEKAKLHIDTEKIQAKVGAISTDGLRGCVVLWDSIVDDARLTLATIKDAHLHGGIIANYVRFVEYVSLPCAQDTTYRVLVEDCVTNKTFEISAKKIVSSTGPWTDMLWQKDPNYNGEARLETKKAKGIHLILPRCTSVDSTEDYGIVALTQAEKLYNGKQRAIFILPADNKTSIVGTTETTPEGDPEDVRASSDEVSYLLSEARRLFPSMSLERSSIIGTYAGIRPLIANNQTKLIVDNKNFVSREHIITESASGILYVYGGKLTTHRLIAEEAVDYIADFLSVPRNCQTSYLRLPCANADAVEIDAVRQDGYSRNSVLVDEKERLIQRYGYIGYVSIQEIVNRDASFAEPITDCLPFLKAEILYAFTGEMAISLDDLLWRRTRIGWTQGQGLDVVEQITDFLRMTENWNQTRKLDEIKRYKQHLDWLNHHL